MVPKSLDSTLAGRTRLYVVATIITAIIAVTSIVILALVKPENTSTGTLILGILLPVITAFLAASVGHLGAQVDGRLTQLIDITGTSEHAKGKIEEKHEESARRKSQRNRR